MTQHNDKEYPGLGVYLDWLNFWSLPLLVPIKIRGSLKIGLLSRERLVGRLCPA
jgi:hypothetical protein